MLVVSVGNVGDGKQFLQAVQMLVISVGNVGNGKQYVLQTVQMVIISVDEQFSADSTDVSCLC